MEITVDLKSLIAFYSNLLFTQSPVAPIFTFNVFPPKSRDQEGKRFKKINNRNHHSLTEVPQKQQKVHLIS